MSYKFKEYGAIKVISQRATENLRKLIHLLFITPATTATQQRITVITLRIM